MTPNEITEKWQYWQKRIGEQFDIEFPDIKDFLFIIGVQELGQGPKKFSKRQKEELMHIATCKLMSQMGFYQLIGLDQDGWPHWTPLKEIPPYSSLEQEWILKALIVDYLDHNA